MRFVKLVAAVGLCGLVFTPLTASAAQSKNVTQATARYMHRKGVRAHRYIRHKEKNVGRYMHRKRAHIKHYLDTH